jgi:hypothetical protein
MSESLFDIEQLRWENIPAALRAKIEAGVRQRERDTAPRRPRQPRTDNPTAFLAGPIPLDWFRRATPAGFAAWRIGFFLWHTAGLRSRQGRRPAQWHTGLRCSQRRLAQFVGHRSAVQRGIIALERAGLLRVTRQGQRTLEFDLLGLPTGG